MNTQGIDAQEFDDLYVAYSDVVFRNILKFTKEPVAAKDILQDVFVKLWEKKDEIKKSNSVSGLLFVISYHLCVNYARRKMREEALHKLLSNLDQYSSDGYSIRIDEDERELLLEKAMLALSPQKRRTLTLCKLEGKTYLEAAQELHISPHTVKEYLSNAILLLNDYMKKQ
ncbi:RNA polymerase sigma-70 factor, ECF subfamily [Filimonas lacunae]|uniref:RNA polymerase sigma-70 factor, ECF subfamily n=1 Tax=Filimonas lacunae TaxID=477680 RepID=A0A173MB66_9BACT|nr:sigma-70 family RNA polymerase sigma factor [Filimonas lacunae]BAV04777.1 RNA polymerase ECF-type sigma factor [Filimonas lacunae]SIT32097.1 RNA polymerase sigma-70 factor, ECF subfamily [Filimonas lacunae]